MALPRHLTTHSQGSASAVIEHAQATMQGMCNQQSHTWLQRLLFSVLSVGYLAWSHKHETAHGIISVSDTEQQTLQALLVALLVAWTLQHSLSTLNYCRSAALRRRLTCKISRLNNFFQIFIDNSLLEATKLYVANKTMCLEKPLAPCIQHSAFLGVHSASQTISQFAAATRRLLRSRTYKMFLCSSALSST